MGIVTQVDAPSSKGAYIYVWAADLEDNKFRNDEEIRYPRDAVNIQGDIKVGKI
jgi:hypothetical protein